MTRSILSALTISTLACSVALAPACIISGTDDGDDDNGGDTGAGDDDDDGDDDGPATADDSASDTGASDNATMSAGDDESGADSDPDSEDSAQGTDTSVDESGGGDPTGADVDPQEGPWQYQETGGTTNDCSFVEDPSNGFGIYTVTITGAGAFRIEPGDGTTPFECEYGDGAYDCPERLQGDLGLDMGTGADATGHIIVGIEGALQSSTEMSGEQQGRIECEGADCVLASQLLGVTFPCEFTIPFTGTAQ